MHRFAAAVLSATAVLAITPGLATAADAPDRTSGARTVQAAHAKKKCASKQVKRGRCVARSKRLVPLASLAAQASTLLNPSSGSAKPLPPTVSSSPSTGHTAPSPPSATLPGASTASRAEGDVIRGHSYDSFGQWVKGAFRDYPNRWTIRYTHIWAGYLYPTFTFSEWYWDEGSTSAPQPWFSYNGEFVGSY